MVPREPSLNLKAEGISQVQIHTRAVGTASPGRDGSQCCPLATQPLEEVADNQGGWLWSPQQWVRNGFGSLLTSPSVWGSSVTLGLG